MIIAILGGFISYCVANLILITAPFNDGTWCLLMAYFRTSLSFAVGILCLYLP